MNTYDVHFNDQEASNNKGWHESYEYCYNWIRTYNGTDHSYFKDYKGGEVCIVCNDTGRVVHSEGVIC